MAKFKMKQLALAMGAVLGGMTLLPSAQAVNLAPDDVGQVLIFPYYSVRGGWNTLINLTNTSGEVVAAKVRFHESYNSRDVFDFNVILSPYDVWSATVSNNGADIPVLATNDNSCTTPGIPAGGVGFWEPDENPNGIASFSGAFADGGPSNQGRLSEGYVVVLMMGSAAVTVPAATPLAANAIHRADGVPFNCGALVNAFNTRSAAGWAALQTGFPNYAVNPLKGAFSLVNAANGWNATGEAVALADFYRIPAGGTSLVSLQLDPNAVPTLPFAATYHEPELSSANTPGQVLREDGTLTTSATAGAAAVSFVLQRANIYNQWANRTDAAAGWVTRSDWVVTYPTKRFYVDGATHQMAGRAAGRTGLPAGIAPFSTAFTTPTASNGSSCDRVDFFTYNREELRSSSGPIFSPSPSSQALCMEANVITFGGANVLASAASSNIPANVLPGGAENGWMDLVLSNAANSGGFGLPAVGFSLITRQGDDGLNEAFLLDHAYFRP